MICYLDASVLVKAYAGEAGTPAVVDLLNEPGNILFSSVVVFSEILSVLKRKHNNREMTDLDLTEQSLSFEEHFQGLLNVVNFDDEVRGILKTRVVGHALRALDAIHLSSAIWVKENLDPDLSFVCSDQDLTDSARQEGLQVIDPESSDTFTS